MQNIGLSLSHSVQIVFRQWKSRHLQFIWFNTTDANAILLTSRTQPEKRNKQLNINNST